MDRQCEKSLIVGDQTRKLSLSFNKIEKWFRRSWISVNGIKAVMNKRSFSVFPVYFFSCSCTRTCGLHLCILGPRRENNIARARKSASANLVSGPAEGDLFCFCWNITSSLLRWCTPTSLSTTISILYRKTDSVFKKKKKLHNYHEVDSSANPLLLLCVSSCRYFSVCSSVCE